MPIVELGKQEDAPRESGRVVEISSGEAPFGVRAAASIPPTEEGRLNYLKSVYGEDNVRVVRRSPLLQGSDEEQIFIRDPNVSDKFFPFDSSKITLADFTADLTGAAIATIPTLLVGATARNVAAAEAAGAAARQVVAEALPGETGMSLGERAADIAISAGIGGASQGVVNLGARVFDALRPSNILARRVRKAEGTEFAREGRELSEETGIALTLGQETGDQAALMAEGLARRDLVSGEDIFEFEQRQLTAAANRLAGTLDQVSPERGLLEIGESVSKAYNDAVENAFELRRRQADVDFRAVSELSRGRPVVPSRNLQSEIDTIIAELHVPGAGDATARVVNQARRLLSSLQESGEALTADQTNRLLQIYTSAQRGTGTLFRDMDKAQSRLVAGRLKDALIRDLDEAAEAGESEVVQALKLARDRYRVNTEAINELGDSVLARAIGSGTRAPEAIAEKFLRMRPSEIRASMRLLDQISPDAASAVRRSYLDAAIVNARDLVPTRTQARAVRFSAAKFLKAMPDADTLLAAGYTKAELAEIESTVKILERIAFKALEGSPTAPIGLAWDSLTGVFQVATVGGAAAATTFAFTGSVGQAATAGAAAGLVAGARAGFRAFAARKIARAISTPEGRQALRTLSETGPMTRKGLQAMATISALTGTDLGFGFTQPSSEAQIAQARQLEGLVQ